MRKKITHTAIRRFTNAKQKNIKEVKKHRFNTQNTLKTHNRVLKTDKKIPTFPACQATLPAPMVDSTRKGIVEYLWFNTGVTIHNHT